ncbi:MAG: inorganic phosphate transporter [Candidatus Hydrothermarchaeaceae archaeon]
MDVFLIAVIAVGFYVAWNIGANDTANAMATSVGSGVLTIRQAVVRDAVLNFAGAVLFGRFVAATIGKGIVDLPKIDEPHVVGIGALSAAIAAGIWITIASWKRLPVSTTHSVVGAMLGFGLVTVGSGNIHWGVIRRIILSWIISPVLGAIGGFVIFTLIKRYVFSRTDDLGKVEKVFGRLQILAGMFVSFSVGSNDVANAVAPIVVILEYGGGKEVSAIPIWILGLGGFGIVVGTLTWGYKVIETVGRRLTEITPSRGFAAEFSAASIVLTASYLGLPVSTTHTVVGAVIGVGFAKGAKALDLAIIYRILASWLLTVPAAALFTMGIFRGLGYFVL